MKRSETYSRLIVDTGDALFREVSQQLQFLVTDYGLRREDQVSPWGTTSTFHGDLWSLSLFYGEREFDFTAEIQYHQFPRKHPKPLWAVLEALGSDCEWAGPQTRVDDIRLRWLIVGIAECLKQHRDKLCQPPPPELFDDIKRIIRRSTGH